MFHAYKILKKLGLSAFILGGILSIVAYARLVPTCQFLGIVEATPHMLYAPASGQIQFFTYPTDALFQTGDLLATLDPSGRSSALLFPIEQFVEEDSFILKATLPDILKQKSQITAKFPGALWRIHQAPGSYVSLLTPLAEVVNCKTTRVQISLPQKTAERLRLGAVIPIIRAQSAHKNNRLFGEIISVQLPSVPQTVSEKFLNWIHPPWVKATIQLNPNGDKGAFFCYRGENIRVDLNSHLFQK